MGSEIKLVIWDLDETFWKGTLSEGPVEAIEANIQRVKLLNRRGVVNSICSKNDFNTARAKLEELGVWDQFVFTSIFWGPKGTQVRQIIDNMNLRAANVLFVDDNALNREEVSFHNEGIQVISPEEWDRIDCSSWGKDDNKLSRLNNYKLLENKSVAATNYDGDNEEFLHKSEITAQVIKLDPTTIDMDRVVEILNRTNQLNFTKRRFKSGIAQLLFTLKKSGSTAYVVRVADKFGDYGLCGFASVSGQSVLEDFAFSCRLLDMGVERRVLRYLESEHDNLSVPFEMGGLAAPADWVNLRSVTAQDDADTGACDSANVNPTKVFMPAACFSEVVAPFLEPEFSVTGVPELLALNTSLVRKGRTTSITYWGGKADALNDLFNGDFDILHLSTSTEVMFPPVWLPIIGYFPLPVMLSHGELKRHPGLLEIVKTAIRDRGEMFGRDMRDTITRWQVWWVLFGSSIFFVSRQARFAPDRYRRRLKALRKRLPERTMLVIGLSKADEDVQFFSQEWAALNSSLIEMVNAANDVARVFANDNPDVFVIEPTQKSYEAKDIAGHFGHKQNIEIAQRLKENFKKALLSTARSDDNEQPGI
jgi:FkbH-like protein